MYAASVNSENHVSVLRHLLEQPSIEVNTPERAHCLPKVPFARSWILLEGVLGSTYFEFQPVLLGCLGEISFFVFFFTDFHRAQLG